MKNRWALALVSSLLLVLFASGCGAQEPKLGVVDMKKVMQESVYFTQIKALNVEIEELGTKLAAQNAQAQKQIQDKEEAANIAIQQELEARVKAREEQFNQEMQDKHKDFFDQKEKEFKNFVAATEDETNKQIDAYMTELQKPETDAARATEIAKAIEDVKTQATAKVEAKNSEIKSEVDSKLAGDRAAVQGEMEQYVAKTREELFAKHKKELDEFAEGLLGGEQKELNELRDKRDTLMKTAQERVTAAIKTITEAKKLDTVFVDYVANANAVDITNEVLQQLKESGV